MPARHILSFFSLDRKQLLHIRLSGGIANGDSKKRDLGKDAGKVGKLIVFLQVPGLWVDDGFYYLFNKMITGLLPIFLMDIPEKALLKYFESIMSWIKDISEKLRILWVDDKFCYLFNNMMVVLLVIFLMDVLVSVKRIL